MSFHSILLDECAPVAAVQSDPPSCLEDLNLDQVIGAAVTGRDEYNLLPFFYSPLSDVASITYRQEVFRDLETVPLFESIRSFAQTMRLMRDGLSQAAKSHYRYQQEFRFLDAAGIYCDAVAALARDLASTELASRGLLDFRRSLGEYCASASFTDLVADARTVSETISGIRYCLHIAGDRVTVRRYAVEVDSVDYGAEVATAFEKFRQGAVKSYQTRTPAWTDMNHIEAGILDLVAELYPEAFLSLDQFCGRHGDYVDEVMATFDREIQFYVSYLEFIQQFRAVGLPFCYPRVSQRSKAVHAREAFDVALANKLVPPGDAIVRNDFHLKEAERIFVVSGPNQGGKTTFARAFGQLHYLASLGCPVPAREAHLFMFDRLFTHFERQEDPTNLRGKLEDDLLRIHQILDRATGDSIVILNEIFTSTALDDAVVLGTNVLMKVIGLDLLCVCVTFIDEWASLGDTTVSLVSTVLPDDPTVRTYKIVRRPPDGLSYAAAIADKYGLSYDRLLERISS